MKASRDLKRLLKNLDLIKDQIKDELQNIINDREAVFQERSERWQDSESGDMHLETTEEIQEIQDFVDTHFDDIFCELEKFD
jgi:ElaB/YqjD/DUF883 family membrane-anchored ribosome-binding protein